MSKSQFTFNLLSIACVTGSLLMWGSENGWTAQSIAIGFVWGLLCIPGLALIFDLVESRKKT